MIKRFLAATAATGKPVARWRATRRAAILAGVLAIPACEFTVTNPGPASDSFLDRPEAWEALVYGSERLFADAWGDIALLGASAAREIFPAGTTGRFGIDLPAQRGLLPENQINTYWTLAHRARWVAEDAIERFENVMSADQFSRSPIVARAFLWAGFANRYLGENFCDAVIDGGPIEPHTVFLSRAAGHFTRAMEVATAAQNSTIATAARAGRASARAGLGQWSEASADAGQISTDMVFQLGFSTIEEDQYNHIYWGVANTPYRKHTTWKTVYELYFPESGDPRVEWGTNPNFPVGDAGVSTLGPVPWFFQRKYTNLDDGVNLATGREMRLIEAEALLVSGDWPQAMTIINDLRASVISLDTGEPIAPWQATSAEEAWTHLKRERGIELWLEGRRLGDLRRWHDAGTPGSLHERELATEENFLDPNRALCFPVSLAERQRNPNIP